MRIWAVAAAMTGLAGLVACAGSEMPEPDEGARLFAENCVMCHGTDARGNGELAKEIRAELGRRPADLTTIARRNKGVFPRAEVLSYVDGYTRGRLPQQNMPEFGLLLEAAALAAAPPPARNPEVAPTPAPAADPSAQAGG